MADKQMQTEYNVETLWNIANSSKHLNGGKSADLELQLLQALNELSSGLDNFMYLKGIVNLKIIVN